jgi:cell division protein ZapA
MAQVTFEINGRPHTVGCGDGEEQRLLALSKYIDTKVRELAGQVGTVGEARLFLLTCLMLADELGEAYDRAQSGRSTTGDDDAARRSGQEIRDLQDRIARLEAQSAAREAEIAGSLNALATRLAAVADRLTSAA